jgi:hypothetical protein
MDPHRAELIRTWEAQGPEATRLELHTADTWSRQARLWAIEWLAARDAEKAASEAAYRANKDAEGNVANIRDNIAAAAAIIAAIAAIVGALISYLAWLHPRAP